MAYHSLMHHSLIPPPLEPSPAKNGEPLATEKPSQEECLYFWEHASLLYHRFEWQQAADYFHYLLDQIEDEGQKVLCALNHALILSRLGEYAVAQTVVEGIARKYASTALVPYLLGTLEWELGNYFKAEACLEMCLTALRDGDEDYNAEGMAFVLRHEYVNNLYEILQNSTLEGTRALLKPPPTLPAECIFEPPERQVYDQDAEIINDRDIEALNDGDTVMQNVRRSTHISQANLQTARDWGIALNPFEDEAPEVPPKSERRRAKPPDVDNPVKGPISSLSPVDAFFIDAAGTGRVSHGLLPAERFSTISRAQSPLQGPRRAHHEPMLQDVYGPERTSPPPDVKSQQETSSSTWSNAGGSRPKGVTTSRDGRGSTPKYLLERLSTRRNNRRDTPVSFLFPPTPTSNVAVENSSSTKNPTDMLSYQQHTPTSLTFPGGRISNSTANVSSVRSQRPTDTPPTPGSTLSPTKSRHSKRYEPRDARGEYMDPETVRELAELMRDGPVPTKRRFTKRPRPLKTATAPAATQIVSPATAAFVKIANRDRLCVDQRTGAFSYDAARADLLVGAPMFNAATKVRAKKRASDKPKRDRTFLQGMLVGLGGQGIPIKEIHKEAKAHPNSADARFHQLYGSPEDIAFNALYRLPIKHSSDEPSSSDKRRKTSPQRLEGHGGQRKPSSPPRPATVAARGAPAARELELELLLPAIYDPGGKGKQKADEPSPSPPTPLPPKRRSISMLPGEQHPRHRTPWDGLHTAASSSSSLFAGSITTIERGEIARNAALAMLEGRARDAAVRMREGVRRAPEGWQPAAAEEPKVDSSRSAPSTVSHTKSMDAFLARSSPPSRVPSKGIHVLQASQEAMQQPSQPPRVPSKSIDILQASQEAKLQPARTSKQLPTDEADLERTDTARRRVVNSSKFFGAMHRPSWSSAGGLSWKKSPKGEDDAQPKTEGKPKKDKKEKKRKRKSR